MIITVDVNVNICVLKKEQYRHVNNRKIKISTCIYKPKRCWWTLFADDKFVPQIKSYLSAIPPMRSMM